MYSSCLFTADVGTFRHKQDKTKINEPVLRVPLIGRTYIGRAADTGEQTLCDGYSIGRLPEIRSKDSTASLVLPESTVKFQERPSYNGSKIIIPNVPDGLTHWVNRSHGELFFERGEKIGIPKLKYVHRSKSGMQTLLWTPKDGIINEVSQEKQIDMEFPEDETGERYLLLGGMKGSTLEEMFPHYSYYVLVRRKC